MSYVIIHYDEKDKHLPKEGGINLCSSTETNRKILGKVKLDANMKIVSSWYLKIPLPVLMIYSKLNPLNKVRGAVALETRGKE